VKGLTKKYCHAELVSASIEHRHAEFISASVEYRHAELDSASLVQGITCQARDDGSRFGMTLCNELFGQLRPVTAIGRKGQVFTFFSQKKFEPREKVKTCEGADQKVLSC